MSQQVVFHIDEAQKWRLLLHNVKNLLASYSDATETITIEVLANAEAVDGYVLNTDVRFSRIWKHCLRVALAF